MNVVIKTVALLLAFRAFAQDNGNPQTAALQDFEKRIKDYISLEKSFSKGISTKTTDEPNVILDRQHDLAQKLREARKTVPQGSIFTPDIAKEFRRLLAIAEEGQNDSHIKKSMQRAEPVRVTLHVNESYPANIPLQSTPPTILMNLPRLPPELEYRFAGHALVLRDSAANIIVDLIPDALP